MLSRFLLFSPLPLIVSLLSGWLDCPASGQPIDKIIPSKVPLDETFNESVPPGKRYSSKQVVNKQRKAGREVSTAFQSHDTNAHAITYYVIGQILCFFPLIWPYFEACIFQSSFFSDTEYVHFFHPCSVCTHDYRYCCPFSCMSI